MDTARYCVWRDPQRLPPYAAIQPEDVEPAIRERGDVMLWHADARYFEVESAGGAQIGAFCVDPCARTDKRGGAWMDERSGAKSLRGSNFRPVACLACNFLPPARDAAGRDVAAAWLAFRGRPRELEALPRHAGIAA